MTNISTTNSAPGFNEHSGYELRVMPSQSLHQLIFNEAIIAASRNALVVQEQGLRDIIYIPRADILVPLTPTNGQSSHCPFKGTASYWSIEANGSACEKAAWSYDDPYEDVAPLKGYIAFYINKLDCYWRNGIEQELLSPGRQNGKECCVLVAA